MQSVAPFREIICLANVPVRQIGCGLFVLITLLAAHAAINGAKGAELLMFDSSVCEWCDMWREEVGPVYPKTDEGKRLPLRVISIYENLPAAYQPMKKIVFTPTFVLWHEGREIGRIVGYLGEDFFWGQLGELIEQLDEGAAAPLKDAARGSGAATPVSR